MFDYTLASQTSRRGCCTGWCEFTAILQTQRLRVHAFTNTTADCSDYLDQSVLCIERIELQYRAVLFWFQTKSDPCRVSSVVVLFGRAEGRNVSAYVIDGARLVGLTPPHVGRIRHRWGVGAPNGRTKRTFSLIALLHMLILCMYRVT